MHYDHLLLKSIDLGCRGLLARFDSIGIRKDLVLQVLGQWLGVARTIESRLEKKDCLPRHGPLLY